MVTNTGGVQRSGWPTAARIALIDQPTGQIVTKCCQLLQVLRNPTMHLQPMRPVDMWMLCAYTYVCSYVCRQNLDLLTHVYTCICMETYMSMCTKLLVHMYFIHYTHTYYIYKHILCIYVHPLTARVVRVIISDSGHQHQMRLHQCQPHIELSLSVGGDFVCIIVADKVVNVSGNGGNRTRYGEWLCIDNVAPLGSFSAPLQAVVGLRVQFCHEGAHKKL